MMKRSGSRTLLILLILGTALLHGMQLYVPVQDPVYDYLERMATRGVIRDLFNNARPMIRDDVAFFLSEIRNREKEITRADRDLLYLYLAEYRHELEDTRHPSLHDSSDYYVGISSFRNFGKDMKKIFTQDPAEENEHIYVHEDGTHTVWIDVDFMARGEGRNGTLRFMDQLGAWAAIQSGDRLALFVDGYFFHQYIADGWEEPVKEFKGYWYNDHEYEHFATFDRSEAYANLSGGFGMLSLAHYPIVWGNAMNPVILSPEAVPFGSLRWTKQFKHFKYSFFHGSLMTDTFTWSFESGRTYAPKYLTGHQIEIHFTPHFHVDFTELLVYGNRIPEPTYLIPVIFLWPSEHALGDRDNKMIAVGAEWFPLNGLRLYGTVLLDELAFGQIFRDWWANKYVLQGGLQWSPRSLPADLVLEMTAVHPWTYTHKYNFASYAHHGNDLGFSYGPNTRLFSAKLNYDLSARHRISLSFDHLLEGADSVNVGGVWYPVGGEVNQNYEERSLALDNATTWLMGDITTTNSLRLEWLYRWRNQLSFLSGCELRNVRGNTDLYYSLQINLNY